MAGDSEAEASTTDGQVDHVMKQCRKCGLEKSLANFWRDSSQPDGHKKDCSDCSKAHWKRSITREQRDRYIERQTRWESLHIKDYLLRQARRRAKEFGVECSIRVRDIPDPPTHCPITGLQLRKNTGSWSHDSYSLDRRDPSKGYVPGNVAIISFKANNLKSNLTLEQVENLLKYMKGEL